MNYKYQCPIHSAVCGSTIFPRQTRPKLQNIAWLTSRSPTCSRRDQLPDTNLAGTGGAFQGQWRQPSTHSGNTTMQSRWKATGPFSFHNKLASPSDHSNSLVINMHGKSQHLHQSSHILAKDVFTEWRKNLSHSICLLLLLTKYYSRGYLTYLTPVTRSFFDNTTNTIKNLYYNTLPPANS